MPAAQHEHWQDQVDGNALDRLGAALARIAAAAGRKQEELRQLELTARSAQHETDELVRSRDAAEADAQAARAAYEASLEHSAADADARLRTLSHELSGDLDRLIEGLRAALPDESAPTDGEAPEASPQAEQSLAIPPEPAAGHEHAGPFGEKPAGSTDAGG